jgi:hypothetical protein
VRHVHITGFARGGTNLLKNLFVCFNNTYIVAGEVSRVGFYPPTGAFDKIFDKVVVTKDPQEVDAMERLIAQPRTRVIFSIRDPRDRVCSTTGDNEGRGRSPRIIYTADDSEYYDVRMRFLEKFRDQILVVKYEDIIQQPDETQERIAAYCDLEIDIPFAEGWAFFSENERENQLRVGMNGLRPLDDRAIGRWKTEPFREAVQEYVDKNPLVQSFIEEFYPS